MEKEMIKPSASSTTIISSSDGPTSVLLLGSNRKPNMKQKLQRTMFLLRKKWYALWLKPNPHTMEETANYIRERYDFMELAKESKKYQRLYNELRSSFIMQYEPHLLGEYAIPPELKSENEKDVKEFLDKMRLQQEKANEVPEELFSLEYYYFEKQENDIHMDIQLESRYGYIGGGASGKFIPKFRKIHKDVYRYYGVSEDDIKNHTKRYDDLLRCLAMRH